MIPFKSDLERKIQRAKKALTKIQIERLHISKSGEDKGAFSQRNLALLMKEGFWKKVLKQSHDLVKMEQQKLGSTSPPPDQQIHFLKSQLKEKDIKYALNLMMKKEVSKLVGILTHFVYWAVFGNFNSLPID